MPASSICEHTLAGVVAPEEADVASAEVVVISSEEAAAPSEESDEQPDTTRSAAVAETAAKIFNEFIGLFFKSPIVAVLMRTSLKQISPTGFSRRTEQRV